MRAPAASTSEAGPRGDPQQPPAHTRYAWTVIAIVCTGLLGTSLEIAELNVVYPVLAGSFGVSTALIGWVSLAYMIVSVSTLAIFGRLADLVGRKRVYVGGLVTFLLGSALSVGAPGFGWLVGARVVSGLGGAMMTANSVALIGAVIPANRRGTAIGLMETTVAGGLASGPIVGGFIADALGWRAIFVASWPFSLAALGLAIWLLRDPPRKGPREGFDFLGAAVFAGGMASFLLGLTNGTALGWGSPTVLGALGLGLALLAAFVWIEGRVRSPMIPLWLFRHPVFAAANLAKVACYFAFMAAMFLAPFYFEQVLGFRPAQVGPAMLPFSIALSGASLTMGPLSDRVGWRVIAPAGMGLAVIGALLLARVGADGGLWAVFVAFLVLIFGLGSFISPNDSAIVGAAPRDKLGVASGILAVTRSLGMIVGIAAAGTIVAAREPVYLANGLDPAAAFVGAFNDVFLVTAGVCLLGALCSLVGGGGRERS